MTQTATIEPIPSLAALRQAHVNLLQRSRTEPIAGLLDEVDRLVQRGSASGAHIGDESERWEAQGVLDYWISVLYRAHRVPSAEVLQPFDPSLAPEIPDDRCPYRGLEAFREAQHGIFFGRSRVISEMLTRLAAGRLLIIVGPSGSGKSSLALAGLVPALKSGRVPAKDSTPSSDRWRYLPPIVPGIHPLQSLAAVVAKDSAGSASQDAIDPERFVRYLDKQDAPAVIVIDQFEEVFTLCTDDGERRAFIDCLLAASQSPGQPHRVVLTMRSDFDANVAAVPALQTVFERAQYRIPAFNAAELREAIERPAELVGLKFEEGIVDRLVKEILGEPAGLPLLQFALLKLWERRDRNRVTLETYRSVRGPLKALEQSAEDLYAGLLPEEQVTARRILLRIVRPGSSLEVTSNRVPRESVHGSEPRERVDRVLDKLIAAGLLRQTGGPDPATVQIEVAHEALLRNWPRLVEWLEDERVRLRRRFSLTAAAQQWAAHGKDPGGLLGGSLLQEARAYDDLDATEREFVAESQKATEREARQKEWRFRLLVTLLVALLALATGLGWAVWRLRTTVGQLQTALDEKDREANSTQRVLSEAEALRLEQQQTKEQAARALDTAEAAIDAAARAVQASDAPSASEQKLDSAKSLIYETKRSIGVRTDPAGTTIAKTGRPTRPTAPPKTDVIQKRPDVAPPAAAPSPAPSEPGVRPPLTSEPAPARPSLFDDIQIRASSTETGRRVENTTLPLYDFRIWLDGSPQTLRRIERVEYEFNHPTFRDKVQQSTDRERRFEQGYAGWGCLTSVKVTVFPVNPQAEPESVNFDMCSAVQYRYRK